MCEHIVSSLLYIHKMLFPIVLKHSILGPAFMFWLLNTDIAKRVIFVLLPLLWGLEQRGHDKQKWWLIALLGSAQMRATALARTLEAWGAKVPILSHLPGTGVYNLVPAPLPHPLFQEWPEIWIRSQIFNVGNKFTIISTVRGPTLQARSSLQTTNFQPQYGWKLSLQRTWDAQGEGENKAPTCWQEQGRSEPAKKE